MQTGSSEILKDEYIGFWHSLTANEWGPAESDPADALPVNGSSQKSNRLMQVQHFNADAEIKVQFKSLLRHDHRRELTWRSRKD